MKKYLFIFFAVLMASQVLAQAKIKYTYDASGNRIKRELTTMFTGGGDRSDQADQATESSAPIKVWPNPATYQINIEVTQSDLSETPSYHAELYDIQGRLVQQMQLSGLQGVMPVEALSAGTYFLMVRTGQETLKWTVQKL
jgi:Secretion system C-terminal sorting domain